MKLTKPEPVKPTVSSVTGNGSQPLPRQYSHTTRCSFSQAAFLIAWYLVSSGVITSASSPGSEPRPSSSSIWKKMPTWSLGSLSAKPR